MKIEERSCLIGFQTSQLVFFGIFIQTSFCKTIQAEPLVSLSVTPTTRVGQTAFITEWRWVSDERFNTVGTWNPGPRLDHVFFSYKGDQWLYGGHINAKNYYDLWLASGNEPWTRIPLPSGLIQAGPPKRPALCVVDGTLALYPLAGDTVWLLDVKDNVWTAFVCFGSSVIVANGTAKNYCPGNPGRNAISWCDAQEGRLSVYSGNVTWSFSLSPPHWLSHVISEPDASRLSRCSPSLQAGLAESDKAGLYLLCEEDDFGTRKVLRLKVKRKGVQLDDLGSLSLIPGNVSNLGMTIAHCDEIVALVLAQEDNLPVWVIDNETGCLVKTGNSWVGYALKWLQIYSAVDYTLTCAGNTYKLRNPRVQPESLAESGKKTKYWPNRRGSFQMSLIELGELIKVDQDGLHLYHNRTATEALVFFALSLLMFLTFGVAWFFKRCVTMPTAPRGWPGSWGRSAVSVVAGDCTPTARYTPIPRGEIGLIT